MGSLLRKSKKRVENFNKILASLEQNIPSNQTIEPFDLVTQVKSELDAARELKRKQRNKEKRLRKKNKK